MKIRINQDVTFNWKLTVGGESVDLSKLELSVEITTPSNKKIEITPNIQFDTLEFNYRPKQVGEYILSAYLNRFKDGETALDIKAFEGVKYTWNQDFSTDDNLEATYVELAGDFNFVPNAPSVDLSDYAKTTYVDTQINNEATARTQADSELQSKINTKQDTLTAGENIKIENNVISAIDLRPSVDLSMYAEKSYVDTQIEDEATARTQADSELQSKINTKQDKIIAGVGINITDNTISCTLDTTIFKVVDSLPAAPLSGDENKIHLVLSTNSEEGNTYDEYLWANNSWEKIGSYIPSVDLSMYAEKSYVDSQISMEITARTQADAELRSQIDSKQDTLTAGDNIKIENNVISVIGGGTTDATELLVKITWSELKVMRDNSQLVAGQQYRITDYTCTTTQAATKSAGHVFDIIVTADDESALNEVAIVVKHDGDEYFANSDLRAWKIWYCIDNDTNRFVWADTENGKGVIYRMIDEFNNDVPYDFKNIQFYRQWDSSKELWSNIQTGNVGVPCYTFSSSGDSSTTAFTDMSLSKSSNVYSNVIKEYINIGKQTLNNICFFGNSCYRNYFGSDCYFNSFGTGCDANTFGCRCNTNSFGYGCSFNTFGNKFEYNSLGTYCLSNSFGNDCSYNSLDDTCFGNSFGNMCVYNSIGESCSYNSFGNGCNYIKFASDSSETTKYGYYQNNHFGDGCEYIVFTGAENVANASEIHNYNFAQGLQGTADNYLIVEGKRKRAYETYISKGTNGTIKESVIAEKQDKLVAGENIKIENNVISAIGGGTTDAPELLVKIHWAELKVLIDNSQLVPDQQYRITDYTCTTTHVATKSAGHVFDIIVTADSTNVLNEEARAIKHDGDTYFADSNLSAWKIWYCIDNDTNRFAWADSTNGKGVIYRMIDEFNNDVPYDFKNIQFYRKWDEAKQLWCIISTDNTGVPCYTFSSNGDSSTAEFTDMSLSVSNNVYSNVIKEYIINRQTLNNNCFFGDQCNKNTFGADCLKNTFGNKCSSNTFGGDCFLNSFGNECNYNSFGGEFNQNSFGSGCSYNSFGSGCYINSFGSDCYLNSFGSGCHENSFDRYCYLNSFGSGCHHNSFGSDCKNNSFGSDCHHNSFRNNCNYNSFGGEFNQNSFGSGCSYNSFGSGCYINSFGSDCYLNSFGSGCHENSFGADCRSNSFGNSCNCIKFASDKNATTKYTFYQNNHFGDLCSFILFKGVETASAAAQVQNYNFAQGLQGTESAYISIDGKRNRKYETKVAKNSSGVLKIYCEADSIR